MLKSIVGFFSENPIIWELFWGLIMIGGSALIYRIIKKYTLQVIEYAVQRSRFSWYQTLHKNHVFHQLLPLIPAILLYQGAAFLPTFTNPIQRLIVLWILLIITLFLDRLLNGALAIYSSFPVSQKKPLKGYVQVLKLILYLTVGIVIVSILIGQSPWVFLSGLGALTAVLLLVFRDTILSFIASLQIMYNDLVRVGDWIEMPKYGADGNVIELALHTVKIQNWDNTIIHIPTYKLIEDSFKNWRGMLQSRGRRIKRSILLDQSSISFLDDKICEDLRKVGLLQGYLEDKLKEIQKHNTETNLDTSHPLNGRNLTNIGTFRAYMLAYLRNHPRLRQDMILMVRQLEPTTEGLPLEVYAFSREINWVEYEAIQSDLFDHFLAVVPAFGLRVYQHPSGEDLKGLKTAKR